MITIQILAFPDSTANIDIETGENTMIYTIGLSIIVAGLLIGNPVIVAAGGFVIMIGNSAPMRGK